MLRILFKTSNSTFLITMAPAMALIKMHWLFPRQPHLSDANQYTFSKQTPQQRWHFQTMMICHLMSFRSSVKSEKVPEWAKK